MKNLKELIKKANGLKILIPTLQSLVESTYGKILREFKAVKLKDDQF